ncbi:MAG: 4-oxalocrotonate decarboxylase [Saprospiraceae bacterium]|nr:4-oxalocrotonate decarboxylase [Saprospiraceae bacterium]
MNIINYHQIAERLDEAAFNAKATEQISNYRQLNIEEAYAVQAILIARRYIRGEKLTGLKLGFTSKAKMEQMGVHDMIWGRLTDGMLYKSGDELPKHRFIHPRAEPEIAFLFKKEVDKILHEEDMVSYLEGVAVAIEIIDSRYENFKFSLEDVIADNCSSSGYVIGQWHTPTTPIRDIGINLSVNGTVEQEGNSNAILGNPIESLTAISRLALEHGERIMPGHVVLAGAATSAIFIQKGQHIEAQAEGLGSVNLNVV